MCTDTGSVGRADCLASCRLGSRSSCRRDVLWWYWCLSNRSHAGVELWSEHLTKRSVQHAFGQTRDMVRDSFSDKKHAEVVGEVITVVGEEVVAFRCVDLLETVQVF